MRKIVLSFLIFVLFSSCSPSGQDLRIDKSFLMDQPCAAPCWYMLKLGESSYTEVSATLRGLAFIDLRSIKEYTINWDNGKKEIDIYFEYKYPNAESSGFAKVINDKLIELHLPVHYTVDIEAVVEKYGPPEHFTYREYHPEVGGCAITLEWPSLQIAVSHTNTKSSRLCEALRRGDKIPKETKITRIIYYVPEESGQEDLWKDWPGLQ